jgi:hypothetical protein
MPHPPVAAFAFTGFAPRNFQMLWEFSAKTVPITFFNIGADRIKTPRLLLYQFTASVISA